MDPFRSELQSARERIAALESEVVRLHEELQIARRPKGNGARSKRMLSFIVVGVFGALLFAVIPFIFLFARQPSVHVVNAPSAVASFEGIAVAPEPTASTISPQPTASGYRTASRPGMASSKPCSCQTGDPLCSCSACDPPFTLDRNGLKRYKPHCL
jgi:hypothetical protein